ncbi:MAG: tyrosine-type recombinase/integrase [Brevundimonas sp.]
MAKAIHRLNWRKVPTLGPGWHADGLGLYVRVEETGNRRWVFVFHRGGRRRELGLGSAETVPLADARRMAADAREQIRQGLDPIAARRAAQTPQQVVPFSEVASSLLDELEKGWKSPKQRPQWEASLQTHAPAIWKADVALIDTEMVLKALRPIWMSKPETASRVRSRIERVLDAAKVRGFREGENPARWRGHMDALLSRAKRQKGHHAAMHYRDVPAYVTQLSGRHSVSSLALRFLIFTAARSGEVRGARWDEVDGDTWVIPAERMKAAREHRVPLNEGARAVLDSIPTEARGTLIFPGLNGQLSDMTLSVLMRKSGAGHATPHGFRSSFKDWAMDCTSFPDEVSEEALAHTVGSAVRQAYRRGQALEKRRALMAAWSDHCLGKARTVTRLFG